MTADNSGRDDLDATEEDALAATGRALAGLVPAFGGAIGEFLTKAIPNQRIERIVEYVRNLNARLNEQGARIEDILSNVEKADLLEEGAHQAARATTKERVDVIARLVANGLTDDDADLVRKKRLAILLSQVDNEELLVLNAYAQSYGGNGREAWEAVNRPEPAHMGQDISGLDAAKLYEAGTANLLRLGLLQKNYRKPRKGEAPVFDHRRGDFQHTIEISYLGRMLMRSMDRPSPLDAGSG